MGNPIILSNIFSILSYTIPHMINVCGVGLPIISSVYPSFLYTCKPYDDIDFSSVQYTFDREQEHMWQKSEAEIISPLLYFETITRAAKK